MPCHSRCPPLYASLRAGVTTRLNQALDLSRQIQNGLILMLVCMQFTPLVWAFTDGIRVLGAELVIKPGVKARLARQWAELLIAGASALTVLAGRDPATDTHVYAISTNCAPAVRSVARSASCRRQMQRAGVICAWMTLASLAGTPIVEVATRAIFALASLRDSYGSADNALALLDDGSFRMGVTRLSHLVDVPLEMPQSSSTANTAAYRIIQQSNLLAQALLEDASEHADYLGEWAAQVKAPPMDEVAEGLLGHSCQCLVTVGLDTLHSRRSQNLG